MYGITDGRMKLIHYIPTGEQEFFNLDVDPLELGKNSEEYLKEHPEVETRLKQQLASLQNKLEVPPDQLK